MAKSSKIEPADLTLYQEHMEKAAKVGLRRLRRLDVFDVSLSLAQAFATAQDDERRRLIMSTRLCLLNEQLQKLSAMEPPSEPKPKKARKSNQKSNCPQSPSHRRCRPHRPRKRRR